MESCGVKRLFAFCVFAVLCGVIYTDRTSTTTGSPDRRPIFQYYTPSPPPKTNNPSANDPSANDPSANDPSANDPSANQVLVTIGDQLLKSHPEIKITIQSGPRQNGIDASCLQNTTPHRPDYTYHAGFGFYKFHGPMSWHDARRTCINEDSHLAIPNSEAEARLLFDIYRVNPRSTEENPDQMHVGMHDIFVEGEFETVLGDPLNKTGYVRWGESNPSNSDGNENCGSLHERFTLNDIPCKTTFRLVFVCEKEFDLKCC